MASKALPVRSKAMFAALAATPRRSRSGPVAVRFVADVATDRVCVAYAVGRRYGGAVDRNRCRRRLRAVVRECVTELPPGSYLIGAGPGAEGLAFQELRERVFEALRRATEEGGR